VTPPVMHPAVRDVARHFRVVGMTAPGAITRKAGLLTPNHPGERASAVVFDVVRCTTTIAALFAAGAHSVTVSAKGSELGSTPGDAARVAASFGVPLCTAGELGGKPIPGGVVGNSPRRAACASVQGCHVLFFSTNLGLAYSRTIEIVHQFGSTLEVLLGNAANIEVLARRLHERAPERLFLMLGGFYENPSFEDLHAAGRLIQQLGIDWSALDDEARTMLACGVAVDSRTVLREVLRTGWIGRCLEMYGMLEDLDTVVDGTGISQPVYQSMRELIPELHFCDGVPVLFPSRFRDSDMALAQLGDGKTQNHQPINERT
jgi:phosphosulfolactate phosphohydrolase-like enzyme